MRPSRLLLGRRRHAGLPLKAVLENKKKEMKNKGKNIKVRSKKEIIFNTLKYLYSTKKVDIKHLLES